MATQDLPSKGMKAVLIQHVEKIVFGIVCVVCLVLVVMSFLGKESDDRGPTDLTTSISNAKTNIDRPTWADADRAEDLSTNLEEVNSSEDDKINYALYSYDMPWHMPHYPPSSKRSDPQLYPVMDLIVSGQGVGALAKIDGDSRGEGADRGRARPRGGLGSGGLGGGGAADEDEVRMIDTEVQSRIPGYSGGGDIIAEGCYYVAITGVIPNALQYDAYEDAFSLATDYQPNRDVPKYLTWVVERANVTEDPYRELTDDDWVGISHNKKHRSETGISVRGAQQGKGIHWAEGMPEVVDSNYTDQILTGPIPPIMLRDVSDLATHPLVPLQDDNAIVEDEEEDPANEEEAAEEDDNPILGRSNDSDRDRAESSMTEMSSGSGNAIDKADVEYKLFRFFDLDVQPGQVYRYRVVLYLEDPNNPEDKASAPPEASLDDEVARRIRLSPDTFHRQTVPSEPTDPVAIRPGRMVVAGSIGEPNTERVRGGGTYPAPLDEEQTGDVLVIVWDNEVEDVDDRTLPVNVMGVRKTRRGEVLYFTQTVDVLDPTRREFVRVEDYDFEIEKVILDMTGGWELPGIDRNDKPLSGGQILMLDEYGNLEVHDSLLEENRFRELQYMAEEPLDYDDDDDRDLDGGRGGLPGVPGVPAPRRGGSALDR